MDAPDGYVEAHLPDYEDERMIDEQTPLSERWPDIREGTLGVIESEVIAATGNGEFAAYLVKFLREGKREVAALEKERNKLLTLNREILAFGKAEVERLRAANDLFRGASRNPDDIHTIERLRAVIRELEWSQLKTVVWGGSHNEPDTSWHDRPSCPACGGLKPGTECWDWVRRGHTDDCWLSALTDEGE